MELITLSYPLTEQGFTQPEGPLVLAIGHFDGVHRGHMSVIGQAVDLAKATGKKSAVMTFNPHPKEVLGHGAQYYQSLTPLNKKSELFAALGVDYMFVVHFDLSFASLSPEQFMEQVLMPLRADHLVVGFDFTFGHLGAGNTDTLRTLASPDVEVHVVQPFAEDGVKVSSTRIREGLAAGDVSLVSELLGRPYEVMGKVVHGDGRGRHLGFPTANIDFTYSYVLPRFGVYAVVVIRGEQRIAGVLNFGNKPTFNSKELKAVMEVHLLDFVGDIYTETLKIQLISFIRPEQRFGSVDELVEQITKDKETARETLAFYV